MNEDKNKYYSIIAIISRVAIEKGFTDIAFRDFPKYDTFLAHGNVNRPFTVEAMNYRERPAIQIRRTVHIDTIIFFMKEDDDTFEPSIETLTERLLRL